MQKDKFDEATALDGEINRLKDLIRDINKAETLIAHHQQLCWALGRDAAGELNEKVRDEMRELVQERKRHLEQKFKEL